MNDYVITPAIKRKALRDLQAGRIPERMFHILTKKVVVFIRMDYEPKVWRRADDQKPFTWRQINKMQISIFPVLVTVRTQPDYIETDENLISAP
jgi:hypothetical protein